MRQTYDYFQQAGMTGGSGAPQSSNDWASSYQTGLQELGRQEKLDETDINNQFPIGGVGTDINDLSSQMNRRQTALVSRQARLARQTSDFKDSMGKSFGSWRKPADPWAGASAAFVANNKAPGIAGYTF